MNIEYALEKISATFPHTLTTEMRNEWKWYESVEECGFHVDVKDKKDVAWLLELKTKLRNALDDDLKIVSGIHGVHSVDWINVELYPESEPLKMVRSIGQLMLAIGIIDEML